MLPLGNYSYEIRLDGQLIAYEEINFDQASIVGSRRSADGLSRHNVEATLDAGHHVRHVTLSYSSSLFTRKASYEAIEENLRGRISGLAGRNEIVITLGRFREIDPAGFLIFRALIIGHIRKRRDERWTGRVAVIDPHTLVAASVKQNCARRNTSRYSWIYETRMGDREEMELDEAGRILRCHDNRGVTFELILGGTRC
jgi:hypothetical protein